ncbi:MAG: hypothetical protein Edafosvirus4_32 [Edafosvirus sp.]|uniref:Uncharacterized protein n=1 Tax=Edafosvirus sp. TaxID=2487765 RepID=A0A3G4ZT28_9VIRU|nr:MAG: hypothetical protein Edafosvirus4_32 [Edafosvirus sp.]
MCYNQSMSLSFAILGIIGWCVTDKKKYGPEAMIIAFYTTMEILQTIQYSYLDLCNTFENKFLTIIAHILVCVQPSLWNWYRMRKNNNNRKIFTAFFWAGIIFAVFYTLRLFWGWLDTTANFPIYEMNVGKTMCTIQGPSHVCWMLPYASFQGLEPNYFTYLLIWFFPTLYEDTYWLPKITFWIGQIALVHWTTPSMHENNSVWCLWSVPLFIGFFVTLYFKQHK